MGKLKGALQKGTGGRVGLRVGHKRWSLEYGYSSQRSKVRGQGSGGGVTVEISGGSEGGPSSGGAPSVAGEGAGMRSDETLLFGQFEGIGGFHAARPSLLLLPGLVRPLVPPHLPEHAHHQGQARRQGDNQAQPLETEPSKRP